jgi:HEAT repeat protein
MLIENALKKAKSSDEDERKTGLEQLSQFGTEDTYEMLLEILKNTKLNKSHEKQIIKTLYKILNNIKNMNK